jgi:hypothetical protein
LCRAFGDDRESLIPCSSYPSFGLEPAGDFFARHGHESFLEFLADSSNSRWILSGEFHEGVPEIFDHILITLLGPLWIKKDRSGLMDRSLVFHAVAMPRQKSIQGNIINPSLEMIYVGDIALQEAYVVIFPAVRL